jgi:hypothetical protein
MTALAQCRVAPRVADAPPSPAQAVLRACLVAGSLDLLAAVLLAAQAGVGTLAVLRGIASGVLGPAVRGSGWGVGLFGLCLHFAIMLAMVLVYQQASRLWPALARRPGLWGPAYGAAAYIVMNGVVLPLSDIAFRPSYTWPAIVSGLLVHMLCVGWPIALILSRAQARATTL